MKTRVPRTFLVLAAMAVGAVGLAAQSSPPIIDAPQQTFRSAVDVVPIQASVCDVHGRPLKGLRTTDFEVRDNGQLRPILSFRADRTSPVSLAVLVDMSGSMRMTSKIAMARQALDSVVSQLNVDDDEVALFTFDSELHERQGFTHDVTSLRDALSDFPAFGTTSIYDATADAARRLGSRSTTRKALVVVTDGIDTSSRMTASEVSAIAGAIDAPVYIVSVVPSAAEREAMEGTDRTRRDRSADLRDLAAWTGGQLVFVSTVTETVVASARLVDELRQQYVLAIEAASAHEWRRLDIRVRHSEATVKARSGYFGG